MLTDDCMAAADSKADDDGLQRCADRLPDWCTLGVHCERPMLKMPATSTLADLDLDRFKRMNGSAGSRRRRCVARDDGAAACRAARKKTCMPPGRRRIRGVLLRDIDAVTDAAAVAQRSMRWRHRCGWRSFSTWRSAGGSAIST